MKLLCAIKDIDKKQIVQKQVLDEIVLVKPLFVRDNQRLHLERSHLRDHVYIIRTSVRDQNILQLRFIQHLEELIS